MANTLLVEDGIELEPIGEGTPYRDHYGVLRATVQFRSQCSICGETFEQWAPMGWSKHKFRKRCSRKHD
jgi:hypothetical protein